MNDDWQKADLAPIWDFDQEKMLIGVYVGKQDNVGRNQSTLYNVKSDKGIVSFWGSSLLNSQFSNIAVGEEVLITFKGRKTSERTGRTFKDFEVLHRAKISQTPNEDVGLDEVKLDSDSSD